MKERLIREFEEYERGLVFEEDKKTFSSYFNSLRSVKDQKNSDIIRNSDIEKSYYYQIIKGKRIPGRDKIISLCIGAGLNQEETSYALILNENAPLYMRKRRDRIIAFALKERLSVTETNLLLDEMKEMMLSEEMAFGRKG